MSFQLKNRSCWPTAGRRGWSRGAPVFQVGATTVLGLIAVLTFHFPSDQSDAEASIGRVVWRLAVASLPAMVLLFSTSPLMRGWLRRRGQEVPYYLYAISNAGSLAALLLYPFLVETNLGLADQRFYWHGCLIVVAGLLAAAGFIFKQQAADRAGAGEAPETPEPISFGVAALWLWLSALTCVGMLGATYHIVAEIGSSPIAWVGPFGVYLFGFMVTFAGRWRGWMTMTTIVWLALSLTGFMVFKGFTAVTVNAGTALWLLSLTASGSFLGNALLYSLRPVQRFEKFYLVLAAGGVLGGLLSATVIPSLLSRPIEFELASVALLTTGLLWLTGRREPGIITVIACVVLFPVLGLGFHQAYREYVDNGSMRHVRDLYGHIMIKTDARSVVLSSDTTTHGSATHHRRGVPPAPDALLPRKARASAAFWARLRSSRPAMNVGVIGLGAGTIATYARKDDTYDFCRTSIPRPSASPGKNFTFIAEVARENQRRPAGWPEERWRNPKLTMMCW